MDRVQQIARAHKSARPKPDNPAWLNCHTDCGFLLQEIERMRSDITALQLERDTLRREVLYLAEYGAMSAGVRRRLRTLAGSSEPQDGNQP